ncbi:MAG TPA: PKD domain-containing protein [Solirubrobacteraceae bacterium]|jgi:hypothetical protein
MTARTRLAVAAGGLALALLLAAGMLFDGAAAQDRRCTARGYSVARPVARITATPATVTQGRRVGLDASASRSAPGAPIAGYFFDLDGDGAYETQQAAALTSHRFKAVGTSFVRLVVLDVCGLASLPVTARITVTEDLKDPKLGLSARRRMKLRTALRRGIPVRARCNEPCRLTATALASRRVRRSLRLRSARVARKTGRLSGAGTRRLTLKLSKRARARIRPRRSVRLTLRVEARDVAGNRTAKRRKITLRR